jgi:hypothetical protein
MEAHHMMPHDTSARNDDMNVPLDTALDTALRQHFQSEIEPDDDGFSERVMAELPARPSRHDIRWVAWVERVQLTAISVAACGIAVVTSIADPREVTSLNVATYTLIGLLAFWAIPSRWSRG